MPQKTPKQHKKPARKAGPRRDVGTDDDEQPVSDTPITDAAKRRKLQALLRKIETDGIDELSERERRDFAEFERTQNQKRRWQIYGAIPRAHWLEMSGVRSTTQLRKQAAAYGLPLGGEYISLKTLAPALHDFLAANSHKLGRSDDDPDGLLAGPETPSLERLRRAQAILKEMEIEERRKDLVSRELVAQHMDRLGTILRRRLEIVERGYGPEPCEVFEEGLTEFEAYLAKTMKNGNGKQKGEPNGKNTIKA